MKKTLLTVLLSTLLIVGIAYAEKPLAPNQLAPNPVAGYILTAQTATSTGWVTQASIGGLWQQVSNYLSPITSGLGVNITGNAYRYNGVNLGFASTTLYNWFFANAGNTTMTGNDNVGVGHQVLVSDTTGYRNVGVGFQSLYNNTTGYENTGVGFQSLYDNTTGLANVAIGKDALRSNTVGYGNTAIGNDALTSNTEAEGNNAFGQAALYSNTVGFANSAFGRYSLQANTTGVANSGNSYRALYSNTTGGANNCLGYRCLYNNTTGNSNLSIGSNSLFDLKPTAKAITSFSDYSGTVPGTVLATSPSHGRTTGDSVVISGTAYLDIPTHDFANSYDSTYTITKVDNDSFYFATSTYIGSFTTGWWTLVGQVGSENIAIGDNTGASITTGSGNTIIGTYISGLASNLTDNIILGSGHNSIKARYDGTDWNLYSSLNVTGTTTADCFSTDGVTCITGGSGGYWTDTGTDLTPATSTRGLLINGTSILATTTMTQLKIGNQTGMLPFDFLMMIGGTSAYTKITGANDWIDMGYPYLVGVGNNYSQSFVTATSTGGGSNAYLGNLNQTTYQNTLTLIGFSNQFNTTIDSGADITGSILNSQFSLENAGAVTGDLINLNLNNAWNGGTLNGNYIALNIGNVDNMGGVNNYAIKTGDGLVSFGDDLTVAGNATTSGYLTVGTAPTGANFTSGNLNVQDNLVVGGNATTSGYLTVGTAPTGANFTSGNLNVQDNLVVGAGITLNNQRFTSWLGSNLYNNSGVLSVTTTPTFSGLTVTNDATMGSIDISGGTPTIVGGTQLALPVSSSGSIGEKIVGNYLYMVFSSSTSTDQLRIVDISDVTQPKVVGGSNLSLPTNGARELDVVGKYAYIGFEDDSMGLGDSFRIVDVSNSANPFVVGGSNLNIDNPIRAVKVVGKYAYLGVYTGNGIVGKSLAIVDVSDPYNPKIISPSIISGLVSEIRSLDVVGKYAYLVSYYNDPSDPLNHGKNVLRIVDISDPTNPVVVGGGNLDLPDYGRQIKVIGKYAYVAFDDGVGAAPDHFLASDEHLRIIDVSDPANPTVVGGDSISTGDLHSIFVANGLAYVTDITTNSLHIIDVASSTNPTILKTVTGLPGVWPVVVSGNYAYVGVGGTQSSNNTDALRIIDLKGLKTGTANIGSLKVGMLNAESDLVVASNIYANGLNLGAGGIRTDGNLSVNSTNTPSFFGGQLGIGTTTPDAYLTINGASNATDLLRVATSTNQNILLVDKNGNVGIGTTTPASKLTITGGDVWVTDYTKGIILTSPDGTCHRGTISDLNILTFNTISCPN